MRPQKTGRKKKGGLVEKFSLKGRRVALFCSGGQFLCVEEGGQFIRAGGGKKESSNLHWEQLR